MLGWTASAWTRSRGRLLGHERFDRPLSAFRCWSRSSCFDSFALWPEKNLGTLLWCSAAVMLGTQFWHAQAAGCTWPGICRCCC